MSDDINVICTLFSEALLNIAKKFIPNKTVTIRQDDLPWYDSSLRRLGRKKDRLYLQPKTLRSLVTGILTKSLEMSTALS